jgi:hypothetical protein
MSVLRGATGITSSSWHVAFVVGVMYLAAGLSGWAQESAPPTASSVQPVDVHLCCAGLNDPEVDTYAKIVGDTITVVLERRGAMVHPEPTEETVLRYEYRIVGFLPRLHVFVTVCDAVADTRIAGAMTTARGNITLYSAVDELVVALDPVVDAYIARREHPEGGVFPIPVAERVVLPTEGSEGTTVRYEELFSGTVVSSDFVVAEGAVLPIRISRAGFYTEEITVPITDERQAVPSVPLRPLRRFGAELHLGYPRIAGAAIGGRYYPLPDRLFTAFELTISMTGMFEDTSGRMVHTDPRVLIGYVPLGHKRIAVQPIFSTGIGLVSTFVSYSEDTAPRYFDWYWNVLNVAVEVGQGMIRPYVRGGIGYYIETERGLWQNGINPDRLTPEIVGGTVVRW